jgi:hypothetical protein
MSAAVTAVDMQAVFQSLALADIVKSFPLLSVQF